jgi:hypothetical protein
MLEKPGRISLDRPVAPRMKIALLKLLIVALVKVLSATKGLLIAAAMIAAIYLAISKYGVPAVLFAYEYNGAFGQERYKSSCSYLSPIGIRERPALGGRCAWVAMVKGGTF